MSRWWVFLVFCSLSHSYYVKNPLQNQFISRYTAFILKVLPLPSGKHGSAQGLRRRHYGDNYHNFLAQLTHRPRDIWNKSCKLEVTFLVFWVSAVKRPERSHLKAAKWTSDANGRWKYRPPNQENINGLATGSRKVKQLSQVTSRVALKMSRRAHQSSGSSQNLIER